MHEIGLKRSTFLHDGAAQVTCHRSTSSATTTLLLVVRPAHPPHLPAGLWSHRRVSNSSWVEMGLEIPLKCALSKHFSAGVSNPALAPLQVLRSDSSSRRRFVGESPAVTPTHRTFRSESVHIRDHLPRSRLGRRSSPTTTSGCPKQVVDAPHVHTIDSHVPALQRVCLAQRLDHFGVKFVDGRVVNGQVAPTFGGAVVSRLVAGDRSLFDDGPRDAHLAQVHRNLITREAVVRYHVLNRRVLVRTHVHLPIGTYRFRPLGARMLARRIAGHFPAGVPTA